jgi:hypothetical protein
MLSLCLTAEFDGSLDEPLVPRARDIRRSFWMFCSNCGAEASGNFCAECGAALKIAPASSASTAQDWSGEISYQRLIRIPAVREAVSRHAASAKKRLSDEDFLALADKVIPLGVPLDKFVAFAQPMFARLGVETGKERSETLSSPPGSVIVAALCSLARHGQALQQVQQFGDGCLLEATLPLDLWSLQGTFYVSVREVESGTRVEAATKIKGQAFDWGKSERCLKALFADIKSESA